MNSDLFKQCPACGYGWKTRTEFLHDPGVALLGYQVNFKQLEAGLFLFNHRCQGTMSIKAERFRDMYNGPVFGNRLMDTEACSGFCLHQSILEPCPAQCECAYVREVLQKIKETVDTGP